MPQPATRISIFLASPGDVEKERAIAFDTIHEWNDLHTSDKNVVLQLKSWKTSTCPDLAQRPQAAVNEQSLDDCDLVVGIFWTRFGSPTGVAGSGTEEEIRRSLASKKHVLLYFSDVPASPSQVDHAQYQQVTRFREEFRHTGFVWSYQSHDEFKDYFRRHLNFAVQRLLTRQQPPPATRPANPSPAPNLAIQNNAGVAAAVIQNFIYQAPSKGSRRTAFAPGSIGSDLLRKNYISYLVRRYNEFLKIGKEKFGDERNVPYSFISTRIIQKFKVPANDVPLTRFEEVADLIKYYIDGSIVGKNNHTKGWQSYESFDEFCARNMTAKPRRPRKSP